MGKSKDNTVKTIFTNYQDPDGNTQEGIFVLNARANIAIQLLNTSERGQEEKRQRYINMALDMWLILAGRGNELQKKDRLRLGMIMNRGILQTLQGKEIPRPKIHIKNVSLSHVLEAHFLWDKKPTRKNGFLLYSLLNSWEKAEYGAPSKRSWSRNLWKSKKEGNGKPGKPG